LLNGGKFSIIRIFRQIKPGTMEKGLDLLYCFWYFFGKNQAAHIKPEQQLYRRSAAAT